MNKGDYWFKFVFSDWRTDPALRRCSMATQGVWINMLCVMHESASSSVSGTVTELARLVGCFPDELASAIDELEATGTADVTRSAHTSSVTCNAQVTLGNEIVTVMSRRLDRQVKSKEQTKLRVQKFRANADVTHGKRDRVRDKSKSKSKTLSSHSLSTGTSSIVCSPADAVDTRRKGSRLPSKFAVTKAMREWVSTETPGIDWERETKKFVDYYRSVAGQKGVRLDWPATWRNWMRNASTTYAAPHAKPSELARKRTNADRIRETQQLLKEKYG